MNIKQQKQIHTFLVEAFGNSRGNALFGRQAKTLGMLIEKQGNRSGNQMKTLVQTILPRIALYQVLLENGFSKTDAYAYMRKYMLNNVAAKKHMSMMKMESIPGFYAIYSRVFLHIMRTTDLQESILHHGRDSFDVTITKCLWHTACVENNCAELCRLFCDVDDVTYIQVTLLFITAIGEQRSSV